MYRCWAAVKQQSVSNMLLASFWRRLTHVDVVRVDATAHNHPSDPGQLDGQEDCVRMADNLQNSIGSSARQSCKYSLWVLVQVQGDRAVRFGEDCEADQISLEYTRCS